MAETVTLTAVFTPDENGWPVPRHLEIPLGTSRAICRQLGIEAPSKR